MDMEATTQELQLGDRWNDKIITRIEPPVLNGITYLIVFSDGTMVNSNIDARWLVTREVLRLTD